MCIKKTQIFFIAALALMIFLSIPIEAQFKKLTGKNMVTESDIYIDENNVKYSDLITIQFYENIIDLPKGEEHAAIEKINKPLLKEFFKSLKKTYKDFEIIKVHPNTFWGDTVKTHIRTGKPVIVPDLSQIFRLKFKDLVPIDSVITILKNLKEIKNAEPPMIMYTCLAPNDPNYTSGNKWSFNKIEAEKTWDITIGATSEVIGILDQFSGASLLHVDLGDKVLSDEGYYGGHGTSVAGVAGAKTNNSQGVASLGWDVKLRLFQHNINTKIRNAADSGCSVINISLITEDNFVNPPSTLRQACEYAINLGVVIVAAAGNDETPLVNDWAPAKYNFGSAGQVIAVSATKMDGSTEKFVDGWNYSPGTNPLTDPENAFIDIASPGFDIPVITGSSTYGTTGGTSLSAPFVSALVALILSINDNLLVPQVYEIITKSTDKVDQSRYPDDANGWNRRLGYGRINAYKALKYTIEHFGGTLPKDLTIPSGETWNIQSGTTLKFAAGKKIIVNGTLNVNGTSGSIVYFDRIGTSGNWGGIQFNSGSNGNINYANIKNAVQGVKFNNTGSASITVSYSTIENNSTYGIYLYNSSPVISYNTIQNNGSYGIYCYNYSSPSIHHNTITGHSNSGVYLNYYSPAYISYWSSGPGSNLITLNNKGIYANYQCNAFIYYNNIYGNTSYELEGYQPLTIDAEYNWWGAYPPNINEFYSSQGAVLDYTPALSNPQSGMLNIWADESVANETLSNTDENEDMIKAWELQLEGKYEEAIKLYENVIEKEISTETGNLALIRIDECYWRSGKKGLKEYIDNKIKTKIKKKDKLNGTLLELENHWLLEAKDFEGAISNYDEILNEFQADLEMRKHALFNKSYIYQNFLNNESKAKEIFAQLRAEFPNDELVNYVSSQSKGTSFSKANKTTLEAETNEIEVPSSFELLGNYPNPFNPTTIINYSTPVNSNVKISIYDIMGSLIKSYDFTSQSSGYHNVEWDGTNEKGIKVSSGTYIYRMEAVSLEGNGERFMQSKKMILLK